MIQALRKGEIDAVDEISASGYNSLKGAKGITRIDAHRHELRRTRRSTPVRRRSTTSRSATAARPRGPEVPSGRRVRHRPQVADATRCCRVTARPVAVDHPAGVLPTSPTAPGDGAYTYDPAKAEQMLDAAGYTKDADGNRIDPADAQGDEPALRCAPNDDPRYKSDRRSTSSGWLQDGRHQDHDEAGRRRQADRPDRQRRSTTCSCGAGASSPTRASSSPR